MRYGLRLVVCPWLLGLGVMVASLAQEPREGTAVDATKPQASGPEAAAPEGSGPQDSERALDALLRSVIELKTESAASDPGGVLERLRAEFGRLRVQSDHALRGMKEAKDDPSALAEMTRRHADLTRRAQETQSLIGILVTLRRAPDEEVLGLEPIDSIPVADVDALARWVDRVFEKVWEIRHVRPSDVASDDVFLRRTWLDLAGRVPTLEAREAFFAIESEGRRGWLIDEIVASSASAEHFANYWGVELLGRGYLPDDKHRQPFVDWLRQEFEKNLPHDAFVRELLTNKDVTTAEASPAAFLAARQSDAVANINKITGAFLGLQIQCAQCHNDPYQKWTQDDFHSLAAFLVRQGEKDKGGNVYFLVDRDRGEAHYVTPDGQRKQASMRYYDGTRFEDGESPRRVLLAQAMAADPQLAKAQVNRLWAFLFGRGLVEPIDNFTSDNPPTVPLVLESLARKYRESGFDNRWLLRVLARTRVYALSAGSPSGDAALESFAQYPLKALTGEQVFDSIVAASGIEEPLRAEKLPQPVTRGRRNKFSTAYELLRDDFLNVYAWEPEKVIDPSQGTIPQTLALLNNRIVVEAVTGSPLLERSLEGGRASLPEGLAQFLYEAVLGRAPSKSEAERVVPFLGAGDRETVQQRVADVLWALFNTAEFRYNH